MATLCGRESGVMCVEEVLWCFAKVRFTCDVFKGIGRVEELST